MSGYNPSAYHYKLVFPFRVPPVDTINWDDETWTNYIRGFRPADYEGSETDKEAWLDYVDQKNLKKLQEQWPNSIVTLVGRDKFNFTKKD